MNSGISRRASHDRGATRAPLQARFRGAALRNGNAARVDGGGQIRPEPRRHALEPLAAASTGVHGDADRIDEAADRAVGAAAARDVILIRDGERRVDQLAVILTVARVVAGSSASPK
jgi:hypothetical protein